MSGLEGFFTVMADATAAACDGRRHFTLWSQLKLSLNLSEPESALRHAWKQLRHQQPMVATVIEDMKKVYHVPTEEMLEQWLSTTFIVSSASSADELYQSVTPIKQPTLYYVPTSSELLFRSPHYTIDGIGILMLWSEYLSALASPKEVSFGDESARLAPVLEEVLGYSGHVTKEQEEKATALFMSWAGSIPGIGPVSKLGSVPSGNCRSTEWVFPKEDTKELIKACKRHSITVTSAVHAAYIKAVAKYADQASNLAQYVTVNQFNLRPYLPEPFNSPQYAASVYYTPHPYKLDIPSTFQDAARSLNTHYQTSFKGNPEALELNGPFTRVVCGAVQTPEFQAAPVSRDALFSSLGVVERYLQREYGSAVKVLDLKMGTDVVMGMCKLYAYTFQDQLRLVYNFNDGFENPEDIRLYLEEVRNILFEELRA